MKGEKAKADPKKNPEGKVHNLAGQALKKMQQANEENTNFKESFVDLWERICGRRY